MQFLQVIPSLRKNHCAKSESTSMWIVLGED
jgi:hypothetical protein